MAGTLVATANDLSAIETIKAGDYVLSTDPDTMQTTCKPVLETYIRKVDRLVHLIISGEEIITTVDHPFYVQGRGFIEAGNLLVGDKLVSAIGEDLLIENYNIEETENLVDVYNFQVEDFHTYHVGDCAVWVHNANYLTDKTPKDISEMTRKQLKENTPEDWDFGLQDNKYGIKDHHILTLKDVNRRRGSWVLETTEITERYKDAQGDMDAELKKFAGDIAAKVKLQLSADYETSDTPSISYTNIQGDVLELTFFSPEMSYNGQYKVNGKAVDLNTEYISKSDYMQQKAGSNSVQFHTATGTENLQLE